MRTRWPAATDPYIDIIAFLLQKNDMPAGQQELATDVPTLKQIFITAKPAGK